MLNRLIFFILILFVAVHTVSAEKNVAPEKFHSHYILNLSLFHPIGLNKNDNDSANINFSLLYGKIGWVQGFDIGGIASVIKNNLSGIQLTGISGVVGESVRGSQISGLFNVAGADLYGLQLSGFGNIVGNSVAGLQASGIFNVSGKRGSGIQGAGIFNVTGKYFSGLQAAGIFNAIGKSGTGIQASGIMNVAGKKFSGLQAAGIFNVAGKNFAGLQASGIINIAGGSMNGLQASVFNVAHELAGAQVGVVNIAGNSKGVQLGIVNYVKNMTGIPVGLVNLSQQSRIRLTAWGSSLSAVNLGAKFMFNKIYTILSVGSINLYKNSSALVYGFYYGLNIPTGRFKVNADLGYLNLDNKDFFKSVSGTKDQHAIQVRGMLEFPTSESFSVFIGSGLSYILDHYQSFETGKIRLLLIAGFELF